MTRLTLLREDGHRIGVVVILRRGGDIVLYCDLERRYIIKAHGYRPAWSELAWLISSFAADATKKATVAA